MATGAPDWQGLQWKTESVQRPNLLFPSGKVIFWDDFESPTQKYVSGGSVGSTATISTEYSAKGTNSLKLVTDDDTGDIATATYYFGLPASKKLGVELNFTLSEANLSSVQFTLYRFTGTVLKASWIRYVFADTNWVYFNDAGGFTAIPGGTQVLLNKDECFHRLKIVTDFDKETYTRFKCNDLTIDMSSIGIRSTANATAPHARFIITASTSADAAATCYIDNVAITEE